MTPDIPDITPYRVFVYGTLRTDIGPKKGILPEAGQSEPAVLEGMVMHSMGRFPGIMPGEGQVKGQVLFFDHLDYADWRALLRRMDGYEGVHHGLYTRQKLPVLMEDGQELEAWVYIFGNHDRLQYHDPVPSGDWAQYREDSNDDRR